MANTMLVQLLAVAVCCLLVTCAPRTRRAAQSPLLALTLPHDHGEDHQRPPRSYEGQQTPAGEAILNSLHHTYPKRREVGGSTSTATPPGAWLLNPDTTEAASSVDYRTERYHISDLFSEGTG